MIGIRRRCSLRPDRDLAELADDRRVALVGGMDGDRAVAEHRLGPGGGDGDVVALFLEVDVAVGVLLDIVVGLAAGERILEVPHVAVDFAVLDLEVGDRGLELRVPVDQPLAVIDQALLVERDEDLEHGLRQALVHGEALARPVAGGAEALQLVEDRAAGFVLPLPDLVDEGLAAHVAAADLAFAPAGARPPSAWRCRHGPCRAATARSCRACARSGPGCPAACC